MEKIVEKIKYKINIYNYFPLEFMGGGEVFSIYLFNYLYDFFSIKYISSINYTGILRISENKLRELIKFNYDKIYFKDTLKFFFNPIPEKIDDSNLIIIFLNRPLRSKFLKSLLKKKIPVLFLLQGITFENFNNIKNFKVLVYMIYLNIIFNLEKKLLNNENFYFQIYNNNQFLFLKKLKISDNNIFNIYHGLNIKNYFVEKNEKFKIIWIGRIEKTQKGIDLLIKIIKLFNKKYHYIKDIEFIIIGSGTYSKYLNKKITNFPNVKYYGFIKDEEKFELLASSNLAMATSNIEPFSLVVLEYLFSGLKVLSTPVSGPKEIISKNEIFGKILDFNPNKFVNEILKEYNQWKNNKDDFFKIKLKRSELAKEYFNIEKTFVGYKNMMDKILKIYNA